MPTMTPVKETTKQTQASLHFNFIDNKPLVNLILHYDDKLHAVKVVEILMSVMAFGEEKCKKIVIEASRNERALIIKTNKAFAELSKSELINEGLTVTVEE